jgi:hypothetical protein
VGIPVALGSSSPSSIPPTNGRLATSSPDIRGTRPSTVGPVASFRAGESLEQLNVHLFVHFYSTA